MAHAHYGRTEELDADRVDEAAGLIARGDVARARSLLEQVIAHCPQLYVYTFDNDREQFIKFWSMAEYLGYIALTRQRGAPVKREVIWLKSAYPRAYYHLAELDIADGNDGGAAEYLDNALRLEPDHPECLLRMAEINARSGDVSQSLETFDLVLSSRPYMASQTLRDALTGKAQVLAQLGRVVEAEACLAESVKYSPENPLAMNMERYVAAARAGNIKPPVQMDGVVVTEETSEVPAESGISATASADVPERPQAAAPQAVTDAPKDPSRPAGSKKWWQFWKSA